MNNREGPDPFLDIAGNSSVMRIVHFLIINAPYNYNKTQIASCIGMSRKTLYSAWGVLEKYNIVKTISSDGKTRFYVLDKEQPITKALLKLSMAAAAYVQGDANGNND